MSYLLLLFGLVLLIKGASLLVDSASKIAKVLGVPSFVIGLSIVAFGTSAPEASIGLLSGIKGANQIPWEMFIGSSIVNITVIFGLTAIILPLRVEPVIAKREIPMSLFIQIALAVMLYTVLYLEIRVSAFTAWLFGLHSIYCDGDKKNNKGSDT
jgi:cation:H+ antiporter